MPKTKEPEQRVMNAARVKEFHKFESDTRKEMEDNGNAAKMEGFFGGGLLRRLLSFAVSIAISRFKKSHPDFDEAGARAEIDRAVQEIGEGKLWDWLMDGGFEKILEWVMLIFSLFAGK